MPGPDKALIIEDGKDIAGVVSLHLKDLGLETDRAMDGRKQKGSIPLASPKATSAKKLNPRRHSAASPNPKTSPESLYFSHRTTRVGSPARRSSLPAASANKRQLDLRAIISHIQRGF
jgi:hypothetical protein